MGLLEKFKTGEFERSYESEPLYYVLFKER